MYKFYNSSFETFTFSEQEVMNCLKGVILLMVLEAIFIIFIQRSNQEKQEECTKVSDKLSACQKALEEKQTKLEAALERVLKAEAKIEEVITSRDEFLSSVSHELRNPLNVVQGNISIMQNEVKIEYHQELLKTCKSCCNALLSVMNNLFDTAQITTRDLQITEFPVEMDSFIEKVWDTAKFMIDEKKLGGRLIVDRTIPSKIKIDGYRVQQIIHNILANAVKFTASGMIRIIFTWVSEVKSSTSNSLGVTRTFSMPPPQLERQSERDDSNLEITENLINTRIQKELPNMSVNNNLIHCKNLVSFETNDRVQDILGNLFSTNIAGEGYLKVIIMDTGCGIPREFHPKVFNFFSKADSSLTRRHNGNGLGLYITENIVEKMKGNLQFSSIVDVGSTFEVELPATVIPKREILLNSDLQIKPTTSWPDNKANKFGMLRAATMREIPSNFRPAKRMALVVDDSEYNQNVFAAYFKTLNFQVDGAANGLIGYEKYKADPDRYTLVIMDIQMPIMDGITACKKIREFESGVENRKIPILMVTANCCQKEQEQCLNDPEIAADYFFRKPFSLTDCRICVQEILRNIEGGL